VNRSLEDAVYAPAVKRFAIGTRILDLEPRLDVFGRLFLLFTLVPILELALLIRVGQWIGTLPTLAIIVTTALIGAWLARREGTRTWRSVQQTLAAGQIPGDALLHGLLVFGGGALLLTPGVLTDLLGLALLAPPSRAAIARSLRRRLERHVMRSTGRIEARFWTLNSREEERGKREE
jgi:UPF0716 protein FxsA